MIRKPFNITMQLKENRIIKLVRLNRKYIISIFIMKFD